jgi:hypothetical protein
VKTKMKRTIENGYGCLRFNKLLKLNGSNKLNASYNEECLKENKIQASFSCKCQSINLQKD